MILKLTDIEDDTTILVDTVGLLVYQVDKQVSVCPVSDKGGVYYVKETIEEIEQQIKTGGICGTN